LHVALLAVPHFGSAPDVSHGAPTFEVVPSGLHFPSAGSHTIAAPEQDGAHVPPSSEASPVESALPSFVIVSPFPPSFDPPLSLDPLPSLLPLHASAAPSAKQTRMMRLIVPPLS
jgi:hypothetical protein